ncbi:FKBP-type peptidyl-prolyl cis-trans isomerase [Tunturiibacter lichenicola]|uniref:FKBP-type peptidyl-prolyl cis-trans isomerase n=1 Tax=Tunturiibacter lichenicola TaxID=2051959 RepID=UPI003D9B070D
MTAKLSSIALLAAITTAATAQTTTTPKTTTATATHHTTTAAKTATTPPNIPKVVGIPKTLYAIKYVDIKVGTGPLAEDRKYYTVRYTGWLTNGTKFDSSFDHPGAEPITFPYGGHRVIAGWDTGFQGMHVGGKRRLFIPYQLAYGESGRPPVIPAKADLIFDLELVSQSDTPPAAPKQAPPAPANPTAQPKPADAPAQPSTAPTPKPSTDAPPTDSTTPSTQPTTPPHPEGL